MNKLPVPLEEEEQTTLVEYLELKGYKFSAIPNSTWTSSWKQKAKNKRVGLRAGLPDLLVIVPTKYGFPKVVFIEMKRKNGTAKNLSIEQHEWLEALKCCSGIEAFWSAGAEKAIEYIQQIARG